MNNDALLKALLAAHPDRVTLRRSNDPTRGLMVGGRGIRLDPSCSVRSAPLFLALDPRDDDGTEAVVSLASAVDESWLGEIHPQLLETRLVYRFDPEKQRVECDRESRFLGLVLRSIPVDFREADSAAVARTLAEALVRDWPRLLAADDAARRLVQRLTFVRHHFPDADFPHFSQEEFPRTILDHLEGCRGYADMERLGLRTIIEQSLDWKQLRELDEVAPEVLTVPSGSRIRLDYSDPAQPFLAVRLQELFGLLKTPRIAKGRVAVVMHLLAPNFRPAQITSDLESFWANTYAEVRKELRARYPKHPWPEDPRSAEAVAVGRRRSS